MAYAKSYDHVLSCKGELRDCGHAALTSEQAIHGFAQGSTIV